MKCSFISFDRCANTLDRRSSSGACGNGEGLDVNGVGHHKMSSPFYPRKKEKKRKKRKAKESGRMFAARKEARRSQLAPKFFFAGLVARVRLVT